MRSANAPAPSESRQLELPNYIKLPFKVMNEEPNSLLQIKR